MLWQAEAWFVNYVVRQLNHFSSSIMRVVHLLDERLGEVEREVDMLVTPPLPDEDAVGASADAAPFTDLLRSRLTAPGVPDGRVLHAECGDGSLIEALAAVDLDAYGIDPGTAAADEAVKKGLDVRRDDVLGHLASVADDRLAGLVLSGCVDRMTISERRRLLRSAELKLAPGGTVALLAVSPRLLGWSGRAGRRGSRPWPALARRDVGLPSFTARLHRHRQLRGAGGTWFRPRDRRRCRDSGAERGSRAPGAARLRA